MVTQKGINLSLKTASKANYFRCFKVRLAAIPPLSLPFYYVLHHAPLLASSRLKCPWSRLFLRYANFQRAAV